MKKDGKHSKPSLPQEGGPEEGSWGEGRHRSHETYSHSIKCENPPGLPDSAQGSFPEAWEVRGRSERHGRLRCRMRARARFILPRSLWFYGKHYPLPIQSHHLIPPSFLLIHLPSGPLGMIYLNNDKDEASF